MCHLTPKKKRPKKRQKKRTPSAHLVIRYTRSDSLSLSLTLSLSLSLSLSSAYLCPRLTLCTTHVPTHSHHAYVCLLRANVSLLEGELRNRRKKTLTRACVDSKTVTHARLAFKKRNSMRMYDACRRMLTNASAYLIHSHADV
jgi:hypothetical protein